MSVCLYSCILLLLCCLWLWLINVKAYESTAQPHGAPRRERGEWFSFSLPYLCHAIHPHVLLSPHPLRNDCVCLERGRNCCSLTILIFSSTSCLSYSLFHPPYCRAALPVLLSITGSTQRGVRPGGGFQHKQDIVVQELKQAGQQWQLSLDHSVGKHLGVRSSEDQGPVPDCWPHGRWVYGG